MCMRYAVFRHSKQIEIYKKRRARLRLRRYFLALLIELYDQELCVALYGTHGRFFLRWVGRWSRHRGRCPPIELGASELLPTRYRIPYIENFGVFYAHSPRPDRPWCNVEVIFPRILYVTQSIRTPNYFRGVSRNR